MVILISDSGGLAVHLTGHGSVVNLAAKAKVI